MPNDAISGEFDYSIERVEALIAPGRESALSALQPADDEVRDLDALQRR